MVYVYVINMRDNTQIGMTGNTPGEWCVSYHGTSIHYAKSILINKIKPGLG